MYQVPADESQKNCPICGETFEQVFDEDQDEWMFKDALISPTDNKIYHVHCHHAIAGDTKQVKGKESSSSEDESESSNDEEEEQNNGSGKQEPSQSNGHMVKKLPLDMPPLEDIPPLGTKRVQPEETSTAGSETSTDQTKKPRVVE